MPPEPAVFVFSTHAAFDDATGSLKSGRPMEYRQVWQSAGLSNSAPLRQPYS
jgi:hypothetical protein